jgi:hypothetical protein
VVSSFDIGGKDDRFMIQMAAAYQAVLRAK